MNLYLIHYRLYEYEHQLLHDRIARIRTETKREAMRIFAFVLKYLEIKSIGVDDIRVLNNHGKKGVLAKAITNLGINQECFAYFHELIEHNAPQYKDEITQTMYLMMQDSHTSSECPKYRHKGDRDSIAAQISAIKT